VLGLLALVPIVGFFATMLSGIWLVVISLMLFARSQAVARLWEDAADPRTPLTSSAASPPAEGTRKEGGSHGHHSDHSPG
jgi:hypothetical protein